jgi:alpha-L-arabinofuranosidase
MKNTENTSNENGATYKEGASLGDRWKWNETIGLVVDRPGREGQ